MQPDERPGFMSPSPAARVRRRVPAPSRASVAHGNGTSTRGGLGADNLTQNKRGRWVSKAKSDGLSHSKRLLAQNEFIVMPDGTVHSFGDSGVQITHINCVSGRFYVKGTLNGKGWARLISKDVIADDPVLQQFLLDNGEIPDDDDTPADLDLQTHA